MYPILYLPASTRWLKVARPTGDALCDKRRIVNEGLSSTQYFIYVYVLTIWNVDPLTFDPARSTHTPLSPPPPPLSLSLPLFLPSLSSSPSFPPPLTLNLSIYLSPSLPLSFFPLVLFVSLCLSTAHPPPVPCLSCINLCHSPHSLKHDTHLP